MGNTARNNARNSSSIYSLLASADATYSMLPPNMRLEIEKISRGLMEFGPRKLRRPGLGTEFYEARPYRPGYDNKEPNAKLSWRAGKPIVVEQEAEIRQHFYLWRDPSNSMTYRSRPGLFNPKEASEIMLLALAKHLARNEEMIGILDREGQYRGGKAPEFLAHQLVDVNVITGQMPSVNRPLPKNSTVVLFSDFLMEPEEIVKGIDKLKGIDLKGFMVMVLDPNVLEFKGFKGHTQFQDMESGGKIAFKKANSPELVSQVQQVVKERIEYIKKLCEHRGFKFILQRTDEPLHRALLSVYGLNPRLEQAGPQPAL